MQGESVIVSAEAVLRRLRVPDARDVLPWRAAVAHARSVVGDRGLSPVGTRAWRAAHPDLGDRELAELLVAAASADAPDPASGIGRHLAALFADALEYQEVTGSSDRRLRTVLAPSDLAAVAERARYHSVRLGRLITPEHLLDRWARSVEQLTLGSRWSVDEYDNLLFPRDDLAEFCGLLSPSGLRAWADILDEADGAFLSLTRASGRPLRSTQPSPGWWRFRVPEPLWDELADGLLAVARYEDGIPGGESGAHHRES